MSILQLQKIAGGSVNASGNVMFDEVIEQDGDISYNLVSGEVTVSANGTYVFDWWVSTQTTSASNAAFNLNFSGGSEYTGNTPAKTGNTSGFAILEVTNAPITATLLNANASNVFLSSVPVKAGLRAFNIPNVVSGDASVCFATRQLINVLEQMLAFSPLENITVHASNTSSVTGTIVSLNTAAGADMPSILVIQSGAQQRFFNINNISVVSVQSGFYDNDISYLPLPIPFVQNCNNGAVLGFYETCAPLLNEIVDVYVADSVVNGYLYRNEYGMIVIVTDLGAANQPSFIVTTKIDSINHL